MQARLGCGCPCEFSTNIINMISQFFLHLSPPLIGRDFGYPLAECLLASFVKGTISVYVVIVRILKCSQNQLPTLPFRRDIHSRGQKALKEGDPINSSCDWHGQPVSSE